MSVKNVKRFFAIMLATVVILTTLQIGMPGVASNGQSLSTLYEQNFNNTDLEGVTLSSFTHIVRPAVSSEVYTSYPDDDAGGVDGALKSSPAVTTKAKIDFGGAKSGKIIFQGEFRYESREAASSGIKFFEIFDSASKSILMFTIGNSTDMGFDVRPVYKTAAGGSQLASVKVNGGSLSYKVWQTLRVEIDTDDGTMDVYVSDDAGTLHKIVESGYPWGYGAGVGINDIAYVQSYHSASHTVAFMIDQVKVEADDGPGTPSSNTGISSAAYTVSPGSIADVPSGTSAEAFLANIFFAPRASGQVFNYYDSQEPVNSVPQTGSVQQGDVLVVIAEDTVTTAVYTILLYQEPMETAIFDQNFNSGTAGIAFTENDFMTIQRPGDASGAYIPYIPDGNLDGALLSQRVQGSKVIATLIATETGNLIFEGDFRLEDPVGSAGGAVQFYDFYTASGSSFLKFGCASAANANGYRLRAAYLSNGTWAGTSTTYQLNGVDVPYKTWHTVKIEMNTSANTMSLWVDDVPLLTDVTVSLANYNNVNLKSVQSYHNAVTSETTGMFLIDNLRLTTNEPAAPVAENVSVVGVAMVDGALHVSANISDINGDILGTPLYQWQRVDNSGGTFTNIAGATGQTYIPVPEDQGLYLRAGITPVSTVEPTMGTQVFSAAVGPILPTALPPSISGEVTVLGTAEVGSILTADYTYQSSDSGYGEGASLFLWERADTAEGDYVPVVATQDYTPVYGDKNHYFRVTVTPVDSIGLVGQPKTSEAVIVTTDMTSLVYYVAVDGSDHHLGTQLEPFATLDRARKAVRDSGTTGSIPITVYFHGGDYHLSQSVSFTAQDSGSAEFPVVYKAFGDGEVRFTGSKTIDANLATAVTDTTILDRVISQQARSRLMMIDLRTQGLTDIPSIPDSYGFAKGGWQPMEIYYNNTALTLARWPNDSFLNINYTDSKTSGYTLGYEDLENRASLWDKDQVEGDMFLWGNIGYTWAGGANRIASLDVERNRLTAAGTTPYSPMLGRKFYVFNLIEEIDQPGECYMDRTNGILYFYPPSDVATSKMEVSTLTGSMLAINGASHITFEGLTFTMTRANILNAVNVDGITINNCELSHTSSNAVTLSGSNFTLENSHIYDLGGSAGTGGLHITGGDRKTLTSSGHVIRNNRLHAGDRVYTVSQAPLLQAGGVGHVIENNEIYDASAYAVRFVEANDIQFNYNEVYDAVRLSSDAGAVTWGRDPTMLGIEIKYNYFHNIGNVMGGYGQQSIFTDDGAAGGKIYGNIFYKGTLTKEQGGTINDAFVLKTNGGQYMTVENNIFIDAPVAAFFLSWDTGYSGGQQGRWWLWVHDKYGSSSAIWQKMQAIGFDSDIWKNHYLDTQWTWLNELFSTEFYNQNIKDVTDSAVLRSIALEKAPANTGWFNNNVTVKVDHIYRSENNNRTAGTTYSLETDILPGGQSMFEAYGEDFKLTAEGLAQVWEVLPDFENIPVENMGLKPFDFGGTLFYVGGRAPTISNVTVSGDLAVGGTIQTLYTYTDPDGHMEGPTKIRWYYADEEGGPYGRMADMTGKEIVLDARYEGKYIQCEIIPYDTLMIQGEIQLSEPVFVPIGQVANKLELEARITEALALAAGSVVGDDEGQHTQSVMDALSEAIAAAQIIMANQGASQYDVDRATEQLDAAIRTFENSANVFLTMERFALNGILKDEDNWAIHMSNLHELEDGTLHLTNGGSFASYTGEQYLNKIFTFTYRHALEGQWNGIYFRQKDPDALSWASGNEGYLIALKPNIIELQTRDGVSTRTLEEFPNPYIFDDTEHVIEVGAFDVSDTDTRIIMRVDGMEVINRLQEGVGLAGKDGYFGVYAGSSGGITLGSVTVDKTALAQTIEDAMTLKTDAVVGELEGQYPQSAVDALNTAIEQALVRVEDESTVQADVEREDRALQRAMETFAAAAVASGTTPDPTPCPTHPHLRRVPRSRPHLRQIPRSRPHLRQIPRQHLSQVLQPSLPYPLIGAIP